MKDNRTDYGGLTEDEFVELMKSIVSGYTYKYAYTYQRPEDVYQQAWIEAIEALERFDPEKGDLKRFLRVHVRNRLLNDKRKNFARIDTPCKLCPLAAYVGGKCEVFSQPEEECAVLKPWTDRNESRKNIGSPIALQYVDPNGERSFEVRDNPSINAEWDEIWELLERNLPQEIEGLYWIWKTGADKDGVPKRVLKPDNLAIVQDWVRGQVGDLF